MAESMTGENSSDNLHMHADGFSRTIEVSLAWLGTCRDAGTYGARGAIAPLPFLAGGKGGKGAFFQKYDINEI